jgi:hypothetical protein
VVAVNDADPCRSANASKYCSTAGPQHFNNIGCTFVMNDSLSKTCIFVIRDFKNPQCSIVLRARLNIRGPRQSLPRSRMMVAECGGKHFDFVGSATFFGPNSFVDSNIRSVTIFLPIWS